VVGPSATPTPICARGEAEEIFRFIEFWQRQHGELPRHLVFDRG
jgi:hypothetical protein